MATTVTKVVDPNSGSGYDYTSLSLWEAGQQGDLTGVRDEIAVAKCRCTDGTADTTAFTIDGWTTSATQYPKIWTDPMEGYRHNGTYQTGNKYRIESDAIVLTISDLHSVLDGLQFYQQNTTSGDRDNLRYNSGSGAVAYHRVSNCISRMENAGANTRNHIYITSSGNAGSIFIAVNNIFYCSGAAHGTGIYHVLDGDINVHALNCTFINLAIGLDIGSSHPCRAINCLTSGCTDGFSNTGSWTAGTNYNASSIASDAPGTNSRDSQTFSFVGASDFHLAANDTGALGYGLNLYNDANFPFQDDIDGDDRGGAAAAWDIGADEYVAAGGSSIVPLLLHQYRARRQ